MSPPSTMFANGSRSSFRSSTLTAMSSVQLTRMACALVLGGLSSFDVGSFFAIESLSLFDPLTDSLHSVEDALAELGPLRPATVAAPGHQGVGVHPDQQPQL